MPIDTSLDVQQVACEEALAAQAAKPEPPADATLIGYIRRWDHAHPGSFMAAAEHTFDCICAACFTFLVTTGLEVGAPADSHPDSPPVLDPRWIELRAEYVDPAGHPSDDQIRRTLTLAWELL